MTESTGLAGSVRIPAGGVLLDADLMVPAHSTGLILFAHGSGSSRKSSRNRYVATVLQQAGLATLLMDLLTAEEERIDEQTAHLRFDIPFLAERLENATTWIERQPETGALPIGYFGASTGGGAALVAETNHERPIAAIVSRGGRPDLAGAALPQVKAPTLLIVGGADYPVIEMNRAAMAQMRAQVRLEIVPRATHLFEEPGTLERVAQLASDWFLLYMTKERA
jgi:dienelactone hydrolase